VKTVHTIKSIGRIDALDFTKGILVVFMVIYHSLNSHGIFPYRYLPFVSLGFIMISGFFITNIYFPKYGLDIRGARSRFVVRSIKLLLIFTILNLAGRMAWPLYHYGITFEVADYFGSWIDIYLIGRPYQVAFDVLLPISYTLFLSIFIPRSKSLTPYFIIVSAITIFFVSILMEYYMSTVYIISMISVGIIGIAFGLIPIQQINTFVIHPLILFSLLFIYGIGTIFLDIYYQTQIWLTLLALLIFYSAGVRFNLNKGFPKQISLLGQYSLISYILQIAYLKIMMSLLSKWNIEKPCIITTIFAITIITYSTIHILDHARPKYKYIDAFYKMVFA